MSLRVLAQEVTIIQLSRWNLLYISIYCTLLFTVSKSLRDVMCLIRRRLRSVQDRQSVLKQVANGNEASYKCLQHDLETVV